MTRLERQAESKGRRHLGAIVTGWDPAPSAEENTEAGNEMI